MRQDSFEVQDPDASLSCTVRWEMQGSLLVLQISGREGRFCVSEYERVYRLERAGLTERLRRLIQRLDAPGRCPSLLKRRWPTRPFRWMRKKCMFLGSLRIIPRRQIDHTKRRSRALVFAIVPRGGYQVVELYTYQIEPDTIMLPLDFFTKLLASLEA
jgi:hypothetical protein